MECRLAQGFSLLGAPDIRLTAVQIVMENNVMGNIGIFPEDHVSMPDVTYVMTDENNAAWKALRDNPKHHVIRHNIGHYVERIVHTKQGFNKALAAISE